MNKPYKNRIDENALVFAIVAILLGGLFTFTMMRDNRDPLPVPTTTTVSQPTALVDAEVIDNLQTAGYEVEYDGSTGEWSVDDEVIGWSEAEDEDFEATGMIDEIEEAQP